MAKKRSVIVDTLSLRARTKARAKKQTIGQRSAAIPFGRVPTRTVASTSKRTHPRCKDPVRKGDYRESGRTTPLATEPNLHGTGLNTHLTHLSTQ